MNEVIYTGIDIGSKNLKIMSVAYTPETNKTKIVHKYSYPSQGVTDGYISHPDIFHQSFSDAVRKYKKETGITITEAIFTIDAFGLKSKTLKINHNTVNQSTITEVDIHEIQRKIGIYAEKNIQGKIIDTKLIKYTVNNFDYFSDIEGLQSRKVIAEYIFSYLPENHIETLEKILIKNDISINAVYSGNMVSAEVNITTSDKELGVMNINIGADTTSLSVWENSKMIYLDALNFGYNDIIKKISLDQKISFSEAEMLNKKITENKKIEKMAKISLQEIAKKIRAILVDLNKDQLLPAGGVIYGGGAKNEWVQKALRNELSLPVKKYAKNISDASTDYHNVYGGIISFILNEKDTALFKLPSLGKSLKKIFSNLSLK